MHTDSVKIAYIVDFVGEIWFWMHMDLVFV